MSKISANTLRDKDGASEVSMKYPVRGSIKAWLNLSGTGTISIRNSLNVASTTDNGSGDYTANYTTSFQGANQGFTASKNDAASTLDGHVNIDTGYTVSTNRGYCVENGANVDTPLYVGHTTGDLA